MSNVKFIVWVGGVADYEGFDCMKARDVELDWLEQGYDDVVLEILEADYV